ncbi:hypothetical protein GCM10009794_00630 [Rothia terrae]
MLYPKGGESECETVYAPLPNRDFMRYRHLKGDDRTVLSSLWATNLMSVIKLA